MPRPFFGSGFFPPSSPPPEVYTALVDLYGGDEAAADAWLAAWIAYVGTSAASDAILAAAQALGPPANALSVLRTADIQRDPLTSYAEQAPPIYDQASREVPAGPIPTTVEKSTSY